MAAAKPEYLYGMHDQGGEHLFADRKGWVVYTEALGSDPNDRSSKDYSGLDNAGFGVIARLNNGYYPGGTYPKPELYGAFAQRCANFVAGSRGCSRWIVGNEPNHAQEWPEHQKIDPWRAADVFNQVAAAIHALPGHEHDEVIAPAIAPWNDQAGDWIAYGAEMLKMLQGCGGIGLHSYTHGASPALITSEAMMQDAPYQDRRAEFRAYQDTLRLTVPEAMRHLPVYMTEIAQHVTVDGKVIGWINANSGWVQAAYKEIHDWNQRVDSQKILCVCLYRWLEHDVWGLMNRQAIHADLRAAVARAYPVPDHSHSGKSTIFIPFANSGQAVPPPKEPLPPIVWDERLTQRMIELTPYKAKPGEWFWRIIKGEYWEEKEHTFAVTLDEIGVRKPGVAMRFWNGGNLDKRTELKPNDRWMVDFPMFANGRSYGLKALDGPSDSVFGMGLGSVEQPEWNIHVSYHFTFQWTQMPAEDVAHPPSTVPQPTPQPHFEIGDEVFTGGYVNLRRTPGYVNKPPADIMNTLEPGTKLTIVSGPQIVDNLVWWRTSAPYVGYVAESDPEGSVLITELNQFPGDEVPMLAHPIEDHTLRVVSQVFGVNEEYYKRFLYDGVPLMGHNGVDFAVPVGTHVRAVDHGTILEIKNEPEGFGLHVLVRHTWGDSLYAHLSQVLYEPGQIVSQRQTVALSGNSGVSTGPHLHFGIRIRGYVRTDGYGGYSDPLPFLSNTPQTKGVKEIVEAAAFEFNVDPDLLMNLVFAESRFVAGAESPRGAIGLAQLSVPTWSEWAGRIGAKNIHNPTDNVRVGAAYLAWLIKELDGNITKALSAYAWGIGNVRSVGTPPLEVLIYVYSIIHGTEFVKAYRKL